jgi:hypothetical protein
MIQPVKDPNKLKPYVKYLYDLFIKKCTDAGLKILTIETLRTQDRQAALHKEAPLANPSLVGAHGYGLAFDCAPLKNGKIDWSDYALFKKMGAIGKQIGLEWGGDWKTVDCPHFQYTQGLTTAQIRAGKLPNFPLIPGTIANVPLDKQFRVYAVKLKGNGLTEQYAKDKSKQLVAEGYDHVYYITDKGVKVEVK